MLVVPGYDDGAFDNRFVIVSSGNDDTLFFQSPTRHRTRDRLYFCWDDSDNVWVHSSDTGTNLWLRDGQTWADHDPTDFLPPTILVEALAH